MHVFVHLSIASAVTWCFFYRGEQGCATSLYDGELYKQQHQHISDVQTSADTFLLPTADCAHAGCVRRRTITRPRPRFIHAVFIVVCGVVIIAGRRWLLKARTMIRSVAHGTENFFHFVTTRFLHPPKKMLGSLSTGNCPQHHFQTTSCC